MDQCSNQTDIIDFFSRSSKKPRAAPTQSESNTGSSQRSASSAPPPAMPPRAPVNDNLGACLKPTPRASESESESTTETPAAESPLHAKPPSSPPSSPILLSGNSMRRPCSASKKRAANASTWASQEPNRPASPLLLSSDSRSSKTLDQHFARSRNEVLDQTSPLPPTSKATGLLLKRDFFCVGSSGEVFSLPDPVDPDGRCSSHIRTNRTT
mmetsp:Transcript_10818/g.18948  ORF Transcript_10818/g.18948 Transcript_10818/m.18948 type:complete len:212 (-) Transcript_10818:33-668(-)